MVQHVTRENTIEAAKEAVPVLDLADLLIGPGQMRRGGDVVRLVAYMWGYAPRTIEEWSAAAHLIHEFRHEIPARPPSWHAKQKRQERARSALHRARVEAATRRFYRLMLRDLEASGETDPPEEERELLWEAAGRIAVLLITDREQSEARRRAQPRGAA